MVSIGLGAAGVIGGIISCNIVSVVYGISTVTKITSAAIHKADIVISSKIIGQLKDVLDEAYKEEEKIQQEVDKLYEEFTERIKHEPKFQLDKTISSISTDIFD